MAARTEVETRKGEIIRRGPYPEMTWSAVIVGWFLGSLIAVSISYAALILGFSIEGSELAAILGWGILRGLMGRTSIIENNINQTIASAVNGASSGIMFSVPALLILSQRPGLASLANFDIGLMIFACIAGAFIGLAFVIPLRKQMIDFQRLPFPGGIAVATILKSPGAGMKKAGLLLAASFLSAVVYLWITNFGANDDHDFYVGQHYGWPSLLNITFYGSLMTIGVGFLSGRGGFWFGAGGFICYWLLAPIMSQYAAPDVRKLINPDIRSAVVTDPDLLRRVYDQLGNQPDLVKRLAQSTGIPQVPTEPVPPTSIDSSVESPAAGAAATTTLGELLDSSLASMIVEAMQTLESQWRLEQGSEPFSSLNADSLEAYECPLAVELARHTKALDILSVNRALADLPAATVDRLRSSANARSLMDLIDSESPFEGATAQQLLAVSAAADRYHGVPSELNKALFKPTGIGMLVGAALGGILVAFPLILSAIGSMRRASARAAARESPRKTSCRSGCY